MEPEEKLDIFLLNEEEKESSNHLKTENLFYAHECGLCPRLSFLERTSPIKESIKTLKVFRVGKIFHKFLQEEIFKGLSSEQEFTIHKKDLEIRGRCDILEGDIIIEFKTCRNLNYIFVPKEENIEQLNFYLGASGLQKGKIIYIDKNNLEMMEFDINFDRKLFERTIENFEYIRDCLKKKLNIKDVEPKFSPNCYYCKYKSICFPKQKKL